MPAQPKVPNLEFRTNGIVRSVKIFQREREILLLVTSFVLCASLRNTSWLSSALVHGGVGVEFNELGGVFKDFEGGDGDFSGVDGDVAVVDDYPRVVDALGEANVVHVRL